MAVTPVHLARVSFTFRAFNLQELMRRNQAGLYHAQNQLATGLRFLQPSEDPLGASTAVKLDNKLDRLHEVLTNLQSVNAVLSEVEGAMQDAIDLVRDAHTLALEGVDDGITSDERRSLANVAQSLLEQLVAVGNRKYLNTYLFAGQAGGAPFDFSSDGVVYLGDGNARQTIVDTDRSIDTFTVPGLEFFGAVSAEIRGVVDLDPALTRATRIRDLGGTTGEGVTLGRVVVATPGAQVEIDLRGADTVGDVLDRLNAALPAGMGAELGARGINLTQGGALVPVTIDDVTGGRTARDLGLRGDFSASLRTGDDLNPRVTRLTRIEDLLGGTGLDIAQRLTIQNGARRETINLAGVQTIDDLLNRLDRADLGVWARISDDGARLELRSRVSGTDLRVEEAGGTLATALGLRSLHGGTRLADLNGGLGVETVDGPDLRITTADGTFFNVDLDGAATLQDVLDRLNAAGAGAITAAFVSSGNGLQITDHTAGGGTLQVEALGNSPARMDLGLDVPVSGNVLRGRDVNPLRADSPFTGLLELRAGLEGDDRQQLQIAGDRLHRVLEVMQEVQGELASQAQMMSERATRVEAEVTATRVLLSDARDVDFADAAVRYQQLQTALQANLMTAATTLNLSLLDFLK